MTYPQLPPRVPLLWREDGHLQFGLKPATSLPAHPRLVRALRQLDGTRSPHKVAQQQRLTSHELLEALATAHSVAAPPRPHTSVSVIGNGPLARSMAQACAPRRIVTLTSEREAFATRYVIHAVGAAALSADVVAHALASRTTLLPVCVRQDGIDVGPLVIPGETGCPLCLEFAAIDVDPTWGAVSHQLPRQPLTASAAEISFAAGVVALALTQLEDGRRSDLHTTQWGVTDGRLQRLSITPHPLCWCARRRVVLPRFSRRKQDHTRPVPETVREPSGQRSALPERESSADVPAAASAR